MTGCPINLFFAAHADEIVVIGSAFFILAASINAVDDLRQQPFAKDGEHFTRQRLALFALWIAVLLALIAGYIYANGYASPRMQLLSSFTSLYCICALTVRDGVRKKTRRGYVVAVAFILVTIVAGCLTLLGPLPK